MIGASSTVRTWPLQGAAHTCATDGATGPAPDINRLVVSCTVLAGWVQPLNAGACEATGSDRPRGEHAILCFVKTIASRNCSATSGH